MNENTEQEVIGKTMINGTGNSILKWHGCKTQSHMNADLMTAILAAPVVVVR